MPKFSLFAPFSMMRFSSKPTDAEAIYRSLVASLNGGGANNYSVAEGSRMDAWAYATAMAVARGHYSLEAARRQADSRRVGWMLDLREAQYKLVPGAHEGLDARRRAVTAARMAPGGGSASNVLQALTELLGDDLRALRYTTPAEVAMWPPAIGDQPMSMQLPTVPLKLFSLLSPVSLLGSQAVRYARVAGNPLSPTYAQKVVVGDVLVISTEHPSLAERVVVTATGTELSVFDTFSATFAKAHEQGATVTSGDYPMWESTRRDFLVALSSARATDPETRRKVDELLERLVRGSSTWSIVAETSPGHAGPFVLDASPLDATPLGDVAYP